jgi:hypothetical protein
MVVSRVHAQEYKLVDLSTVRDDFQRFFSNQIVPWLDPSYSIGKENSFLSKF